MHDVRHLNVKTKQKETKKDRQKRLSRKAYT